MLLVVGADRLGNIEQVLKERGLSDFRHITGRQPKTQKGSAVNKLNPSAIILFTDFVGHNVMSNFRKLAKEQNVPFIACKRTVGDLTRCLDKCGLCTQATHCKELDSYH
ncbi:MAG: DUF2325 domain-containing protein [Thiotrichaceae bacterium]